MCLQPPKHRKGQKDVKGTKDYCSFSLDLHMHTQCLHMHTHTHTIQKYKHKKTALCSETKIALKYLQNIIKAQVFPALSKF